MTSTQEISRPADYPIHRQETGPLGAIRRHPLIAFFTLAKVLSWLGWLPYILSQNGLGLWGFRFPELLSTSQLLGVLPGAYLGPIGSALLLTAIIGGRPALRAWGRRLWRWRVAPRWYAITLLSVPTGMFLTGLAFSEGDIGTPSMAALAAFVPVLLLQMVTTGLAEEPGWRDFALVRLQDRFSPLQAAAILGPLWGVWHLPLFLTDWGGFPKVTWVEPAAFLVFCFSFNIVMSWVFNGTGQSLPLSMLMHVGANTFASVLWIEVFPSLDGERAGIAMATGAAVAALTVVIATRGRLGYAGEPRRSHKGR